MTMRLNLMTTESFQGFQYSPGRHTQDGEKTERKRDNKEKVEEREKESARERERDEISMREME